MDTLYIEHAERLLRLKLDDPDEDLKRSLLLLIRLKDREKKLIDELLDVLGQKERQEVSVGTHISELARRRGWILRHQHNFSCPHHGRNILNKLGELEQDFPAGRKCFLYCCRSCFEEKIRIAPADYMLHEQASIEDPADTFLSRQGPAMIFECPNCGMVKGRMEIRGQCECRGAILGCWICGTLLGALKFVKSPTRLTLVKK